MRHAPHAYEFISTEMYGELQVLEFDFRPSPPLSPPPPSRTPHIVCLLACLFARAFERIILGNNNGGQLGYEDRVARGTVPGSMGDNLPVVDLGVDQRVIAVEAGFYHTCALLYVGDVKCWGA